MRARLVFLVLAVLLAIPAARSSAADDAAMRDAQRAAEAWIALVDSGQYGDSWTTAATFFKRSVSAEQWKATVGTVRGTLGKLKSRAVSSVTYATALPGAPDGQYVVIQYRTTFEHKQSALETITPMREADGQWRVSGYYVQ